MALNSVQALAQTLATRLQELENAIWTQLVAMTISNATGDLLNKIGARVGELRLSRSDTDYQSAIRVRVLVNLSRGRSVDIIAVAQAASINSTINYTEYAPNGFQVDAQNLPSAYWLAILLGEAKASGTYGVLASLPPTNVMLMWGDSSSGGNPAGSQWSDSVSGLPANLWGNGLMMPVPTS